MKKEIADKLQPAIWALFGFGLSYSAYVRGNTLVAILGIGLGAFQLYKLRLALKKKSNSTPKE